MAAPLRLLLAISSHGYGHLSQVAPIANALRQRLPQLELLVQSTLPQPVLAARFTGPFHHLTAVTDLGMVMDSALDVRPEASAQAYRNFHRNWSANVKTEAKILADLAPDLILADVPYLTLAAAAQAQIPALALCSIHWGDIYGHYLEDRPEAPAVLAEITAAYNTAQVFLQPVPTMPMPSLTNRCPIGPIARLGRSRREELAKQVGLAKGERVLLVSLGGINTPLQLTDWPQTGWRYLIPAAWQVQRPDCTTLESITLPFIDLLSSVDAVLSKPGYGTFAECACNGVPLLYVAREDWPETPYLVDWLIRHGRSQEITRHQLLRGDFGEVLESLLAQPLPPLPRTTGIEEAVEWLLRLAPNTGEPGRRSL